MLETIGGPDRDRTDDLFHAIQLNDRNLLIAMSIGGTDKHSKAL